MEGIVVCLLWMSPCQDPAGYDQLLAQIRAERLALVAQDFPYTEQTDRARALVFRRLCRDIFPAWVGTRWGFYGTARSPKMGEIACGSFVVTTLQNVGFEVPDRMAAQPAENIIRNLVLTGPIRRFSNAPLDRVLDWVAETGEGLYLVGLDCHVGFLIRNQGQTLFCHANYYPPQQVVIQAAQEPSPLVDSKYRVIGKLLDDEMMQHWFEGRTFRLRFDYFK